MGKITIWKNGFQLEKTLVRCAKVSTSGLSRRGKIRGWSPKSRRRLRRALCENVGDGYCFGFTLTIPKFDCPMDVWRSIVQRFRMGCRHYDVCGIYRVELQQNGSPHLHFVCWVRDCVRILDVYSCWINSISRWMVDDAKYGLVCADQVDGALIHSVHVERVRDGSMSAFRYLADHASKRKQAQLGFEGRQWGYINKRLLHSSYISEANLSDRHYDIVLRFIRRLSKCRVSRGNFGKTVWFTRPETLVKIIKFVTKQYDS